MSEKNKPKRNKKEYQKPKLSSFGKISDLSQTKSVGTMADGGAFPLDKKMCLTEPRAIDEYRHLTSDHLVQESFRRVISREVNPGDVVLDLGTGSGIHTLFALEAGASKVYAVDSHSIIKYAKSVVDQNGFSDRVEFIQKEFDDVVLPEKVDVIISNLGFFGSVLNGPRAAEKYLKPEGKMIPDGVDIHFAPVSTPEYFEKNIKFWQQNHYGFKFSPLASLATLSPHYLHLGSDEILGEGFDSGILSLKDSSVRSAAWETRFELPESAEVHGIGGWYGFYYGDRQILSTKPPILMNRSLWNNFLLPLTDPMQLKAGSSLDCEIKFRFDADDRDSVWWWDVAVHK